MPLKAHEREVLFSTPVLSRQIRKYVESKHRVPFRQIRLDFPDIGINTFCKTISQLVDSGELIKDGDDLCINKDAKVIPGTQADACWKAARILGTFRAGKLAQIAGVSLYYATTLCARWCGAGYLMLIEADGKNIYKMVSDQQVRPVIGRAQDKRNRPKKRTPRGKNKVKKTVKQKPVERKKAVETTADTNKALIARIHIAKQYARICTCGRLFFGDTCPDCGAKDSKIMPTWYYRQILMTLTNKDSCSDMPKADLSKVMEFFDRAGFSAAHPYKDPFKEIQRQLAGTRAQIRKRGKVVLGPDWESRVDGFVHDVVRKQSLDKCCMYELRQVIGWINRTAKYQKSSN